MPNSKANPENLYALKGGRKLKRNERGPKIVEYMEQEEEKITLENDNTVEYVQFGYGGRWGMGELMISDTQAGRVKDSLLTLNREKRKAVEEETLKEAMSTGQFPEPRVKMGSLGKTLIN